jgi:hypothetical protein
MLFPRRPYGLGSPGPRSPMTPKPCASGHAVDPVEADEPRRRVLLAEQPLEVGRVLEGEAPERRAVRLREDAAVVDRLVRAVLEEDRPAAREHGDDGHVDERDRRQDERVLAAEEIGEALLDLLVEHRAAEQARPARMRPPPRKVFGDDADDLRVEVEAEVVARGEVGEPAVVDADPAAVDRLDHRVRHRVRALQLGQLAAGREPAVDPGQVDRLPGAAPAIRAHAARHRPRMPGALAPGRAVGRGTTLSRG